MADFETFKDSLRELGESVISVFDGIESRLRAQMPRLETNHQTVVLLFGFTILGLLAARLLRGGPRLACLLLVLLLILHAVLPALRL